ncbi:MAG: FG-GAP repeat protein, partial [Planctomycetes bacterium]|nr:FG-GAP repeat protein [Planctomycetota bacterium]
VDGDGEGDLLVGSHDVRPGGDSAGRVTVRRRDGALLARSDGAAGERLGGAVTAAGDLDGDGLGDFLAGASGAPPRLPPCDLEDTQTAAAGKVYVLHGGSAPVSAGGTLGAPLRVLTDGEAGALFGSSLTALDDLDGDGAREVGVGSPLAAHGGKPWSGRVSVFRGEDGSGLWTIGGAKPGDTLGRALSGIGDQDGDGAGDLLAGRLRQGGEVAIFSLGDRDGDGTRDACEPCAVPEDLALGREASFSLTRVARRRCFRFEAPQGVPLRLSLVSDAPGDPALLLLRWGAPPELGLFDRARAGAAAAVPGIVIPSPPGGTGYVVVRGGRSAAGFRLLAETLGGPVLLGMTPSRSAASPSLEVSAAVSGAGFPAGIALALRPRAGGAPWPARDVDRLSPLRIDARFELEGAPPGSYDLIALLQDAEVAALPGAFELAEASGRDALRITLCGPSAYRNNTVSRLTLGLENLGGRPLPPPLFQVAGPPGTLLGFSRDARRFSGSALGLGRSALTPDGSLPPGGKVDVPIWFRRKVSPEECPPNAGECPLDFELRLFEPWTRAPVSWDTLPAPAGMSQADWEKARPRLEQVGSTWNHYHAGLIASSGVRARRGDLSASALPAFELAVRRALRLPAAAVTGVVRARERGALLEGAIVVALAGDEPMAYAAINREGYFVVDWLENGSSYRLEVVAPETGAVIDSTAPEVRLPALGDIHGVEIIASRMPTGRFLVPACPPCEAAALPLEPLVPPPEVFARRASFQTQVISSFDPNEKSGSGTQGGDAEIDPAEAIEYRIYFENLSNEGGAAARVVEIVDLLAPELDWTAVELGDVVVETRPDEIFVALGAGEGSDASGGLQEVTGGSSLPSDPSGFTFQSDLPVARAVWSGTVQFQSGDPRTVSLELDILARVEPAGEAFLDGGELGAITWTLSATLDHEPGVPPDVDAGFLPYGCAETEGDASCGGHVSFTVRPRPDVAAGTVVTNDAEITFDRLEAVITDPAATVTIGPRPPDAPSSPSPPSAEAGAAPVPPDGLRLSWQAAYAVEHDLYLWNATAGGARPESPERANVWEVGLLAAGYPGGEETLSLPAGEVWLWQVVARNGRGEAAEGPVWSFTTVAPFRRGDADLNGRIEITDAIRGLTYLFVDGVPPACLDALDADDSGDVDITDSIRILTYLFLGGAEIPAPGPAACGQDPTGDALSCAGDEGRC